LRDIILGGELNFTPSLKEVLGIIPLQELQENYFSHWMEKHQLIDLAPKKLSQTWSNGRNSRDLISKRLYLFLILEGILDKQWCFKSIVEVKGISDHMPISLEVFNA